MIRRPPRSTQSRSSAASDVYKRQYLHTAQTIQMSIVFAAFVGEGPEVTLSDEHQRFEWLSVDEACDRFTWPRAARGLRDVRHLLARGDAGPVEDALRIP